MLARGCESKPGARRGLSRLVPSGRPGNPVETPANGAKRKAAARRRATRGVTAACRPERERRWEPRHSYGREMRRRGARRRRAADYDQGRAGARRAGDGEDQTAAAQRGPEGPGPDRRAASAAEDGGERKRDSHRITGGEGPCGELREPAGAAGGDGGGAEERQVGGRVEVAAQARAAAATGQHAIEPVGDASDRGRRREPATRAAHPRGERHEPEAREG